MFEWLAEAFVKGWLTEKEMEMPDILDLVLPKGFLRIRETAMLEGVCCAV